MFPIKGMQGCSRGVFVRIAAKVHPRHPKKGAEAHHWSIQLSDLPNLLISSLNVHDDAQKCVGVIDINSIGPFSVNAA
jgi:hypothetical protein